MINPCHYPRWTFAAMGIRFTRWRVALDTREVIIEGAESRWFAWREVLRYPATDTLIESLTGWSPS